MTPRKRKKTPGKREVAKKAAPKLSPEDRARDAAENCYEDILRRYGSVQDEIPPYYWIGKALMVLDSMAHGEKYEKDLVGVFIDEWKSQGGFSFGPGQAKYMRVFAKAFNTRLLKKAVAAKLSWSTLRELSGSELSTEHREDIIGRVRQKDLDPSNVVAEVQSITGINQKDPRTPQAKSAKTVPATVTRRLQALAKSLERLDAAMNHLPNLKKVGPEEGGDFCTDVINVGDLAKRCGVPWNDRMARAKKERSKARRRMSRDAKK